MDKVASGGWSFFKIKNRKNMSWEPISKMIQVIQLDGFESKFNVVAFDATGKNECKAYFEKFFDFLKYDYMYTYYKYPNFRHTEPYTYTETFYKAINGQLVKADSFEDCEFYERHFYIANGDDEDMGIACFIHYSVLNSGDTASTFTVPRLYGKFC